MKKFLANLFNDTNSINEKTVIGIASFLVMFVYSIVDVVTGAIGKDLVINERVYTSFETIVLGSFLISAGEKITKIIRNNGEESGFE
jgi:hypothetical protein